MISQYIKNNHHPCFLKWPENLDDFAGLPDFLRTRVDLFSFYNNWFVQDFLLGSFSAR
jgi:hypothetical protein